MERLLSPLPTKQSKVKINAAIESVRGGGGTGFGSITRQSTLDRFIARADLKPPPPDPQVVSDPSFECGNNDSVGIDPETAKTWIYPVNVPLRDYQFAITKTALFSNTLVALPTRLEPVLVTYPESSAEATSFSGSTEPTSGSAASALSDQAHPLLLYARWFFISSTVNRLLYWL
ncbi:unnamed protein product [Brassica oleracea]|uniref:(rape) hypothetical protein n=1 Tax=Brassica napus TaxID=3708 RepID=A0A816K5R0_BRANA|nr:unnamed protein product [Brassica napus]